MLTAPNEIKSERPTRLLVPRDQALRGLKAHLEKGLALRQTRIRSAADLEKAREIKQDWSNLTSNLLNQIFDNEDLAQHCNNWVGKILPEFAGLTQFVERFYEEMDFRLKSLHAVMKRIAAGVYPTPENVPAATEPVEVFEMPASPNIMEAAVAAEEEKENIVQKPAISVPAIAKSSKPGTRLGKDVALIVHSRNEAVESTVGQFILALGFEPNAIYSSGHQQETIEKLAEYGETAFAIILASDDDVRIAREGNKIPLQHAHRGAAFELGYCVGKLGINRVCVLHTSEDGLFRDEYGIVYVPVDPAEGWQLQLARHFRRAGVEVDLNRLC